MGISVFISGIADKDDKYTGYLDVYNACTYVGAKIPDEVNEYFGWHNPNDVNGPEIDIDECIREGREDNYCYWDIDLSAIPEAVKRIRVRLG